MSQPSSAGPWLLLVRHSLPQIDPAVPASRWRLSPEGHERARVLAARLSRYRPERIVSSQEPKAVETAQAMAQVLRLPFGTAAGLHEHERGNVSGLDRAQFDTAVARLFARPGELVFGCETAEQARTRFGRAIEDLLRGYPHANLVVVTHGTVLALYVAALTGLAAHPLWQRLGMPCFAALERPSMRLVEIAETL